MPAIVPHCPSCKRPNPMVAPYDKDPNFLLCTSCGAVLGVVPKSTEKATVEIRPAELAAERENVTLHARVATLERKVRELEAELKRVESALP